MGNNVEMFHPYEKNIEEILGKRNYSAPVKRDFLREIFGHQEGNTKFTGLVDSTN